MNTLTKRGRGRPRKEVAVEEISDRLPGSSPEALSKYGVILCVRHILDGQFHGLWELTQVDPKTGDSKIITDGTSKDMMMNMARNLIVRCP